MAIDAYNETMYRVHSGTHFNIDIIGPDVDNLHANWRVCVCVIVPHSATRVTVYIYGHRVLLLYEVYIGTLFKSFHNCTIDRVLSMEHFNHNRRHGPVKSPNYVLIETNEAIQLETPIFVASPTFFIFLSVRIWHILGLSEKSSFQCRLCVCDESNRH